MNNRYKQKEGRHKFAEQDLPQGKPQTFNGIRVIAKRAHNLAQNALMYNFLIE